MKNAAHLYILPPFDFDPFKKNGTTNPLKLRPLVDCQMCENVSQIDIIDAADINADIFVEKYAYSGRPLLVKNATNEWIAMSSFNFEFFRDLYEDLESPIIYEDQDDADCQFFAWNSEGKAHYRNLKVNDNLSALNYGSSINNAIV